MNLERWLKYQVVSWLIGLSIFLMNQKGILVDSFITAVNATEGVTITLGDLLTFLIAIFMIIATLDCVVRDN